LPQNEKRLSLHSTPELFADKLRKIVPGCNKGKQNEVKEPASHFGELTVASFRTWRGWAPYGCTGLDLSGADRGRTDDLLVANEALSQLSYSPRKAMKRYGISVQCDFEHQSDYRRR
jgi:hypothetical protein